MKNRSKIVLCFLLLTSFFLLCRIVFAEDFSADLVSRTKEGIFTGKIFVAKGKTRMELARAINITRLDRNIVWMLIPEQGMYMELPLLPQNAVTVTEKMPGEIERRLIGTEIIDGKIANKYRIVYRLGNKQEAVLLWVIADLDVPVKVAAENGDWEFEYKNIKIGPQPDSLFEIPAGYQRFSIEMPDLPGS